MSIFDTLDETKEMDDSEIEFIEDFPLPDIDPISDLDSMQIDELRKYLEQLHTICTMISDDEPDAERDEAYAIWESRKDDLRSIVSEITDVLDELKDAVDECDIALT